MESRIVKRWLDESRNDKTLVCEFMLSPEASKFMVERRINENLNISINDSDEIKELVIDLNLIEGYQNYTSQKINGVFKVLMIEKTDVSPIRVLMKLASHDLILFEKTIEKNAEVYFLKMQGYDSDGTLLTFDSSEIVLNDSLFIECRGSKGQSVKLTIQYI